MKYLLILILSTILLSCTQTRSNNEVTHTNDSNVQDADTSNKIVMLTAEPKTLELSNFPDSIKVIMTNNTTDTITTGLHYYIEKLEANEWNEISPNDIVFHDLGWQLNPTDTVSFEKKLYKDRISYIAGEYRIVKYYLKSDYQQTKQIFNVYAQFKIEE